MRDRNIQLQHITNKQNAFAVNIFEEIKRNIFIQSWNNKTERTALAHPIRRNAKSLMMWFRIEKKREK